MVKRLNDVLSHNFAQAIAAFLEILEFFILCILQSTARALLARSLHILTLVLELRQQLFLESQVVVLLVTIVQNALYSLQIAFMEASQLRLQTLLLLRVG